MIRRLPTLSTFCALLLLAGACTGAPRAGRPLPPLEPDRRIERMVAEYGKGLNEYRVPLTQAPAEMKRNDTGNPIGSWVADRMVESATELTGRPVDFAFINRGGLRIDVPAGPVTAETIMRLSPFDNEIVVFEAVGADVRRVLAQTVEVVLPGEGEDPARLRFGFDSNVRLRVGIRESSGTLIAASIGGTPLDDTRTYRFATVNFLATGGNGMSTLPTLPPPTGTGTILHTALIQWATQAGPRGIALEPPPDARARVEYQRLEKLP